MKKVITILITLALILTSTSFACADDFEQNPRAELDGSTLRLTCGPELHLIDNENHTQKETFHLFKSLARWQLGPATIELNMVTVETFTIKKKLSEINWDWLSGIFEGSPFAAVSLRWIVTCSEGETLWMDPSTARLHLPDAEPVPAFRYLSGNAKFTKIDSENEGFFVTAFALKDQDAAGISEFDFSLPAPFGADLHPLSDPLVIHVELLPAA